MSTWLCRLDVTAVLAFCMMGCAVPCVEFLVLQYALGQAVPAV